MCGSIFVVFFKRICQIECHSVQTQNFSQIPSLRTSVKFPVNAPRHRPEPDDVRNQSRRDAPQLAMSLRHRPTQSSQALPAPRRPRRRAAPQAPQPTQQRYEHTPHPLPHTAQHRTSRDADHATAAATIAPAATAAQSATCPATGRLSVPSAAMDLAAARVADAAAAPARLATTGGLGHISLDCPKPSQGSERREFPCLLQLW